MSDELNESVSTNPTRSLKGISLLEHLPVEVIDGFERQCVWHQFEPDKIIVDRDDPSDDVYFIVSGSIRVLNLVGDREVPLGDHGAGRILGELAAIDRMHRSARVVCNESCVLAALPREALLDALKSHPDFAMSMMQHLVGVVRDLTTRVNSLAGQTFRQRIYTELLRLAEPNPSGDGSWLIEPLPRHDELANWCGTEKDEVSGALGGLMRDGVVRRRHSTLLIQDYPKLQMLAKL